MTYEMVVGLEVHAELSTKSKAFCACRNSFGAEVNTQTCPVCAGFPGALPVLNEAVVEYAVRLGLAAGCTINRISGHDRKNYFYPDLPGAYQVTQQAAPICSGGMVRLPVGDEVKTVRLNRIHIEEDTGKLLHESGFSGTLIDFNRAGVPLLEIVTEPDLRSADEAHAFLETLRAMLVELGVSDGKMQEGSIRCDVNVSVRPAGAAEMGTRVEMKNINTFSGARRAIAYEFSRQTELLERGGRVEQETRRWDDDAGVNTLMRSKENANDYRYFPEPNLPPVVVPQELLDRMVIPELSYERAIRYRDTLGLSEFDAGQLAAPPKNTFFEACLALGAPAKPLANWINGDVARLTGETGYSLDDLRAESLCGLIRLVEEGVISNTAGKQVLKELFCSDKAPDALVDELGLRQVSDAGALAGLVERVLAANPASVEAYRGGKTNALGFLVGQCMKESKGKANPAALNELLKSALEK